MKDYKDLLSYIRQEGGLAAEATAFWWRTVHLLRAGAATIFGAASLFTTFGAVNQLVSTLQ